MNLFNWPFDQPPNCAVFTLRSVVFNGAPILSIYHDADDHGWQFLDGDAPAIEDAAIVSLEEIVELDPSVLQVADLPPGGMAFRLTRDSEWQRNLS